MRLRPFFNIRALAPALLGVLCGTVATTARVQARPLDIELLRGTKKIAIFVGTFDPVTLGHIGTADAAINEGDVDYVIMIPTETTLGKMPLPLHLRQEMAQIAARGHDNILIPTEEQIRLFFSMKKGAAAWIAKLAEANPDAAAALKARPPKVMALVGDDKSASTLSTMIIKREIRPEGWIVSPRDELTENAGPGVYNLSGEVIQLKTAPAGISSTQAKQQLLESPGNYFVKGSTIVETLDPAVETFIRQKGLYLDRVPTRSTTIGGALKREFRYKFLTPTLNKLGFYDWARNFILISRRPEFPAQAPGSDHGFVIKRRLGGGLVSDAYLVEIDGQDAVLKIYRDPKTAAAEIERDTRIQRWLDEKTKIRVPELYVSDPQDGYTVTEYIPGPTIAEHLAQPEGKIPEAAVPDLHVLVSEAGRIQHDSGIRLDLRSDNVIIHDGQPYLVDLGTRGVPDPHSGDYDAKFRDWTEEARVMAASKTGCPDILTRVLSALQ